MLAMVQESGRGSGGGPVGASVPTISVSSFGAALPAGSVEDVARPEDPAHFLHQHRAHSQRLDVIDGGIERGDFEAFANERLKEIRVLLSRFSWNAAASEIRMTQDAGPDKAALRTLTSTNTAPSFSSRETARAEGGLGLGVDAVEEVLGRGRRCANL